MIIKFLGRLFSDQKLWHCWHPGSSVRKSGSQSQGLLKSGVQVLCCQKLVDPWLMDYLSSKGPMTFSMQHSVVISIVCKSEKKQETESEFAMTFCSFFWMADRFLIAT